MNLHWTIFANGSTEAAARKVAGRLFARAGVSATTVDAEPYHKSGYKIFARTSHGARSWAEFVVDALAVAQNVAYGWELNGSISEELNAWSHKTSIAGVQAVQVMATK